MLNGNHRSRRSTKAAQPRILLFPGTTCGCPTLFGRKVTTDGSKNSVHLHKRYRNELIGGVGKKQLEGEH